jgi:hypothetical protein
VPSGRGAEPGNELRNDPAIQDLIEALSLSERFHFYLVVTNSPEQASSLRGLLSQEIGVMRPAQQPMVWIELARETVPHVLGRLVQPHSGEEHACHVLDATGASAEDQDWWYLLFQRMNELRNRITASLPGSLLLVLPIELEELFARAAPDFWSIRSMIARITVGAKRAPGTESVADVRFSEQRAINVAGSVHLRGAQFGQLTNTLAASLGAAELSRLAFDLSADVSSAQHQTIVDLAFDLVRWAEANGRLPDLLDRVIRLRPVTASSARRATASSKRQGRRDRRSPVAKSRCETSYCCSSRGYFLASSRRSSSG